MQCDATQCSAPPGSLVQLLLERAEKAEQAAAELRQELGALRDRGSNPTSADPGGPIGQVNIPYIAVYYIMMCCTTFQKNPITSGT